VIMSSVHEVIFDYQVNTKIPSKARLISTIALSIDGFLK